MGIGRAIDWMLGAALYFTVPSLGPIYSSPEWFADLPRTPNTSVHEMLLDDRIKGEVGVLSEDLFGDLFPGYKASGQCISH